jgi:hypothetical protein
LQGHDVEAAERPAVPQHEINRLAAEGDRLQDRAAQLQDGVEFRRDLRWAHAIALICHLTPVFAGPPLSGLAEIQRRLWELSGAFRMGTPSKLGDGKSGIARF